MSTQSEVVSPSACNAAAADRRPRPIAVSMPGVGMLWVGGWLFTLGFAGLGFWKGMLALVIWPYLLGVLAH